MKYIYFFQFHDCLARLVSSNGKTRMLTGVCFALVFAIHFLCTLQPERAWAQGATGGQQPEVPNFFDPNSRFNKPDISRIGRLRFLTTTDFPPFNFIDRKGRLSGFHVDLVRAICEKLDISERCQIQALPFEDLLPALERGDAEALVAGHAITEEARKTISFSSVYLKIPARFVVRNDAPVEEPVYNAMFKKVTGVVAGSAHEAYFKEAFKARQSKAYQSRQDLLEALRNGEIDAAFSDAVSIGFWLGSDASQNCCSFAGGPYLSNKYFGLGLAVALPKDNYDLEQAVNFALKSISDGGQLAELYLRYFPLGLY